jgi:hypothetical protein
MELKKLAVKFRIFHSASEMMMLYDRRIPETEGRRLDLIPEVFQGKMVIVKMAIFFLTGEGAAPAAGGGPLPPSCAPALSRF